MYKCRHFSIKEFVPEYIHIARGEKAWELLDERMLETCDALRGRYGPITINDWSWGGSNQNRGLRAENSPIGTIYSQHRFGRAADCNFKSIDAESVREDILDNFDLFPHITFIELGTVHLHFDVRNCQRIKTYDPRG